MFENVFNIAMRAVKEWVPEKRYLSEGEYRDDLCKVLRKKIERREESGFFSFERLIHRNQNFNFRFLRRLFNKNFIHFYVIPFST